MLHLVVSLSLEMVSLKESKRFCSAGITSEERVLNLVTIVAFMMARIDYLDTYVLNAGLVIRNSHLIQKTLNLVL